MFGALWASPVAAVGDNVASLNYGDYNGCVVKSDGTVWCWGNNEYHQMGDGTFDNRYTPVQVEISDGVFLTDVRAISPGGYDHTCAIKNNDTVRCWGRNPTGQLGDGTSDEQAYAVTVKVLASGLALTNVKSLALGQDHSCALKKNGTVWCWGSNYTGELGDGTSGNERHGAVQVQKAGGGALTGVLAIGAGWEHTCAVMENSTVRCFGSNGRGQLGIGLADPDPHPVPMPVQAVAGGDFSGVSEVDGGFGHTCARKSNRTLFCWGRNDEGELGDGTNDPRNNPVKVMRAFKGLASVRSFAAGAFHTCATTTDDKAYCWGSNANGEVGQGELVADVSVATRVMADENSLFMSAKTVRTGDGVTCFIKTILTVWCMGYAEYGQIGYDPAPDPDPTDYVYFPEMVDFP